MKFLLWFLILISSACFAELLPLHQLTLPQGFSIQLYARVPDARQMTLGTNGIVYVGSLREGKVYAIVPGKTVAESPHVLVIAKGLTMPNGVAFYQNNLYIAARDRVYRLDDIGNHLQNPPPLKLITKALPTSNHHGWRYIAFGPDAKLYLGIGAPCNNCLSKDPRYATIMRMNPDGSELEIFASGVRNTVGFAWHPVNHALWFTDNGRDWLGDNQPPDELNVASRSNLNFGFPFCHGKDLSDPLYGTQHACSEFIPPVLNLPAHVAALGMIFYTGKMFPKEYYHAIFIAEHGSWNRSRKVGYQVISVTLNDNSIVKVAPFVTGWMKNEEGWGRPVDLLQMPDGSVLVSDDYAGAIYRIIYHHP